MLHWGCMTGAIIVDKPEGWTSHDVVNKVRRMARIKKVGHLGTLDPQATGVLPLVVGRATRLSQFYADSRKVYDAVVHFGWSTSTYDREGEVTSPKNEPVVDPDRLAALLERFRGEIEQMPPAVSAKKVKGTPAYKLARKNQPVELQPVRVAIHSLELLGCDGAEARIKVECSAGTYLRTLAHDLGQAYGCGAFLQSLVRLRSAEFCLEQAHTIEQLERLAREGRLEEALIPAAKLLPAIPTEIVDALTATQVRQGRDFRASPFRAGAPPKLLKAVSGSGDLIAVGEVRLPPIYHPIVVL